jgi:hypothetical protein
VFFLVGSACAAVFRIEQVGISPTAEATIGRAIAIASSSTLLMPSGRGKTTTSAAA